MVRKAGDSNPPYPPLPPPPIISYKNGASLKDTLVKAKKKKLKAIMRRDYISHMRGSVPVSLSLIRFQESKQDLMDSSLLNKRETGSS